MHLVKKENMGVDDTVTGRGARGGIRFSQGYCGLSAVSHPGRYSLLFALGLTEGWSESMTDCDMTD